jgi:hydrogenase maturation protein HypF
VGPQRWSEVSALLRSGVASPPTTSMGRLFDAAAAICGVRATVNYEGQAAAELEAAAELGETRDWPMPLIEAGAEHGGAILLDARELILALSEAAAAGTRLPELSARFHNAIAGATAGALAAESERRGVDLAVLSGGVFQNRLLLERTSDQLRERGLRVLTPRLLPPNDGGISFGQAAVAAARLRKGG